MQPEEQMIVLKKAFIIGRPLKDPHRSINCLSWDWVSSTSIKQCSNKDGYNIDNDSW